MWHIELAKFKKGVARDGYPNISDKATKISNGPAFPTEWVNGIEFLKLVEYAWPSEDTRTSDKTFEENEGMRRETCLLIFPYAFVLPYINRFLFQNRKFLVKE